MKRENHNDTAVSDIVSSCYEALDTDGIVKAIAQGAWYWDSGNGIECCALTAYNFAHSGELLTPTETLWTDLPIANILSPEEGRGFVVGFDAFNEFEHVPPTGEDNLEYLRGYALGYAVAHKLSATGDLSGERRYH